MADKKKKLLLLDDEPEILKSLTRLLRKDYKISSFESGHEALIYLENNEIDLIISDMRMPAMSGAEFLAKSREIHPDAIRILLTGYSDMESTIKAINEGAIYSYITKPWDNNDIRLVIMNALKMRRLEEEKKLLSAELAERNQELENLNKNLESEVVKRSKALLTSHEKLKKQLDIQNAHYRNLVDMLGEIIELRQPDGNGQLQRIAEQCRAFSLNIGKTKTDAVHVYLTAVLHEIGKVGYPPEDVSDEPSNTIPNNENYSVIGANILSRLPAFSVETKAIKHQLENFDGSGTPDHLSKDNIPIESRILRIVKAYDDGMSGRLNGAPKSSDLVKKELKDGAGYLYDPELVTQFLEFINQRQSMNLPNTQFCIGTSEVQVGDVLKRDVVVPPSNNVLVKANQTITEEQLMRLKQYEKDNQLRLALFV